MKKLVIQGLPTGNELQAMEWYKKTFLDQTTARNEVTRKPDGTRRVKVRKAHLANDDFATVLPGKLKKAKSTYRARGTDSTVRFTQTLREQREMNKTAPVRHVNPDGYEYESKLTKEEVERIKWSRLGKAIYQRATETEEERRERLLATAASNAASEVRERELRAIKGVDLAGRELRNPNTDDSLTERFGPDGVYEPLTEEQIKATFKNISRLPAWLKR